MTNNIYKLELIKKNIVVEQFIHYKVNTLISISADIYISIYIYEEYIHM